MRANPYREGRVTRILMGDPAEFDVLYSINPHMGARRPDRERARGQWRKLGETFQRLGLSVDVLPPVRGLPDLCFTANVAFPFGGRSVVFSRMASREREPEVDHARRFLAGWRHVELGASPFEAMGDCLWIPGVDRIVAGSGPRTSLDAHRELARLTGAEVISVALPNPRFYHLDTCLSVLSGSCALACREAFDEVGWRRIRELFPRIIEAPLAEADSPGFACNAFCPDSRQVVLQAGSLQVESSLRAEGFEVHPVDVSEFALAGGSVFCLKLGIA